MQAPHTALTGKGLPGRTKNQGGAARARAGNVQAATDLDKVESPGLKANVCLEPVHPVHQAGAQPVICMVQVCASRQ